MLKNYSEHGKMYSIIVFSGNQQCSYSNIYMF